MKKKGNEILRRAFIEADIEYFEYITKQKIVEWTPSVEFERKMESLIYKHEYHPHKSWTTTWKKVACSILIFAVLATSILSVEAIREPVVEFFTKIYEKFSSVFVIEHGDSNSPKAIETEYLPTAIPDGYKIEIQNNNTIYNQIVYADDNNLKIIFMQQILDGQHLMLDTEVVELHTISVGTQNGQYFINKGMVFLSWTAHDYLFFLSMPDHYTIEDALRIAESLVQTE